MRASLAALVFLVVIPAGADTVTDPLADATSRLAAEIRSRGAVHATLRELVAAGPRLAGSAGAERAVQWGKRKMEAFGFDRVTLQPVRVARWTRGTREKATAGTTALTVTALGGSVGTPRGGVDAEVVEVKSLDEVERLGTAVRGKIVFYNRPMDATLANAFAAYGGAVDQRVAGPSKAARFGAVAVLVRSMTTLVDDNPHTGTLHYDAAAPKIPAAALSTLAANRLSTLLATQPSLRVRLELSAKSEGMAPSHNVIGEITGRELPREYVVVGGHLDSWDLSPGAHDNGAGVAHSLEVGRALVALGLRPKRTVRVVLFMAEESGGYGGAEYAKQAKRRREKHVAALESDRGGFAPEGFSVEGGDAILERVKRWTPYLAPLGAADFRKGGSGADVAPLAAQGAATFGFLPLPTHYFDVHHSALDVLSAVREPELAAGAAAMAGFVYLLAEAGV